jgi:hypothetical protein
LKYNVGIHKIKIEVTSEKLKNSIEYEFSLDGTLPKLNGLESLGEIILTIPSVSIVQIIYLLLYFPVLILLVIPIITPLFLDNSNFIKPNNSFEIMVNKFFLLSKKNKLIHLYLTLHMIIMGNYLWKYWLMGIPYIILSNHMIVFYFTLFSRENLNINYKNFLKEEFIYVISTILLLFFLFICLIDSFYPLFFYSLHSILIPKNSLFHYLLSIILIILFYFQNFNSKIKNN